MMILSCMSKKELKSMYNYKNNYKTKLLSEVNKR